MDGQRGRHREINSRFSQMLQTRLKFLYFWHYYQSTSGGYYIPRNDQFTVNVGLEKCKEVVAAFSFHLSGVTDEILRTE